MTAAKIVPHAGPALEAMMPEIDLRSGRQGYGAEDRPIHAGREVSRLHVRLGALHLFSVDGHGEAATERRAAG